MTNYKYQSVTIHHEESSGDDEVVVTKSLDEKNREKIQVNTYNPLYSIIIVIMFVVLIFNNPS